MQPAAPQQPLFRMALASAAAAAQHAPLRQQRSAPVAGEEAGGVDAFLSAWSCGAAPHQQPAHQHTPQDHSPWGATAAAAAKAAPPHHHPSPAAAHGGWQQQEQQHQHQQQPAPAPLQPPPLSPGVLPSLGALIDSLEWPGQRTPRVPGDPTASARARPAWAPAGWTGSGSDDSSGGVCVPVALLEHGMLPPPAGGVRRLASSLSSTAEQLLAEHASLSAAAQQLARQRSGGQPAMAAAAAGAAGGAAAGGPSPTAASGSLLAAPPDGPPPPAAAPTMSGLGPVAIGVRLAAASAGRAAGGAADQQDGGGGASGMARCKSSPSTLASMGAAAAKASGASRASARRRAPASVHAAGQARQPVKPPRRGRAPGAAARSNAALAAAAGAGPTGALQQAQGPADASAPSAWGGEGTYAAAAPGCSQQLWHALPGQGCWQQGWAAAASGYCLLPGSDATPASMHWEVAPFPAGHLPAPLLLPAAEQQLLPGQGAVAPWFGAPALPGVPVADAPAASPPGVAVPLQQQLLTHQLPGGITGLMADAHLPLTPQADSALAPLEGPANEDAAHDALRQRVQGDAGHAPGSSQQGLPPRPVAAAYKPRLRAVSSSPLLLGAGEAVPLPQALDRAGRPLRVRTKPQGTCASQEPQQPQELAGGPWQFEHAGLPLGAPLQAAFWQPGGLFTAGPPALGGLGVAASSGGELHYGTGRGGQPIRALQDPKTGRLLLLGPAYAAKARDAPLAGLYRSRAQPAAAAQWGAPQLPPAPLQPLPGPPAGHPQQAAAQPLLPAAHQMPWGFSQQPAGQLPGLPAMAGPAGVQESAPPPPLPMLPRAPGGGGGMPGGGLMLLGPAYMAKANAAPLAGLFGGSLALGGGGGQQQPQAAAVARAEGGGAADSSAAMAQD